MPGNNCSCCSRSQTSAFMRSSKLKDSKYLEKMKLGSEFLQQKLILLLWEFSRAPRILCVCCRCSWLCWYRYLEQTPAAKVTKLLVIRTADPQPFVMPSVGELSEVCEEEDEGKERGYWNDPHGWGADGEYKLKKVLFVNMRDKVLLYVDPTLRLGGPVWSSQVRIPQLGQKNYLRCSRSMKTTSPLNICGGGEWKSRAKIWSQI